MHSPGHVYQKFHPAPQTAYDPEERGHELHEERGLLLDAGKREEVPAECLPDAEGQRHDHEQGDDRDKDEEIHEIVLRQDPERGRGKNMGGDAQALNED